MEKTRCKLFGVWTHTEKTNINTNKEEKLDRGKQTIKKDLNVSVLFLGMINDRTSRHYLIHTIDSI
jgi:hypothetical protein